MAKYFVPVLLVVEVEADSASDATVNVWNEWVDSPTVRNVGNALDLSLPTDSGVRCRNCGHVAAIEAGIDTCPSSYVCKNCDIEVESTTGLPALLCGECSKCERLASAGHWDFLQEMQFDVRDAVLLSMAAKAMAANGADSVEEILDRVAAAMERMTHSRRKHDVEAYETTRKWLELSRQDWNSRSCAEQDRWVEVRINAEKSADYSRLYWGSTDIGDALDKIARNVQQHAIDSIQARAWHDLSWELWDSLTADEQDQLIAESKKTEE